MSYDSHFNQQNPLYFLLMGGFNFRTSLQMSPHSRFKQPQAHILYHTELILALEVS